MKESNHKQSSTRKKKILILCPYPEDEAPSQRLKYEQYFEHWREGGYEIEVSPFMKLWFYKIVYKKGGYLKKIAGTVIGYLTRVRDLMRLPFYDGCYVHLWVTPFGFSLFESLVIWLQPNMIYDIDDMIFLGHHSNANRFVKFLKGKHKMIVMMKYAKHVITCTPVLDEFVRQYNLNTTDISSTINTETYLPSNDYSNGKQLTIGWSGSHSTCKYLPIVEDVLCKLQEKYDFRVLIIGTDNNGILRCRNVDARNWQEATEITNLQEIDIGIYPLPDEPWVYGKSGLKALQYMALGIPTVATSIGANKRIIDHGTSGFLVSNDDEWIECLSKLIEDAHLRKRVGENARDVVVNRYSIHANKATYLQILNEVYAPERNEFESPVTEIQNDELSGINRRVIESFGQEWAKFDQSSVHEHEWGDLVKQYFGIFPWDDLPENAKGCDYGCGSGRWARYVASKAHKLICLDPSDSALRVARRNLREFENVSFLRCSISEKMPIEKESLDFAYALGVFHHIDDHQKALNDCVATLKPGAPFLVYMYYRFDNRPPWFSSIHALITPFRRAVASMPHRLKDIFCDMIAGVFYWPLARLNKVFGKLGLKIDHFPLSFYKDRSFYIMRNDARDRFGTLLEKRFTKKEIVDMLDQAGVSDVRFSDQSPHWVCVGYKRKA